MKQVKRFIAKCLLAALLMQLLPVMSTVLAADLSDTYNSSLTSALSTTTTVEGFSTAELVDDDFNGEGVWITEIYNNDVERNASTNTRESNGYESINLYDTTSDLMEFIELVSTHDDDIKFNDLYELYHDTTKLTITTIDGSSDVTLTRGQPVVLWNYRTDLTTTLPTEAEFRVDMRIPDNALILKIVNGGGWSSNSSYAIKSKQTGDTICSFTTVNDTHVKDGYSVELSLPMMGSEMEVYRNMTLPSAGYVYASQVRYLYTATPTSGFDGKGVYITEIRPNDINRSSSYGSSSDLMECIEVVNTTDVAIDLNKDYKLVYTVREGTRKILPLYQYSASASNYVGSSSGCTVPAGGTAVLWCFRCTSDTACTSYPTLSEFRSAYGISSSTPVYIFTNQNSFNNTNRGIELFKADGDGLGQLVSTYSYYGSTDVEDNCSAQLKINPEGPEMLLYAANATTTMGTVDAAQLKYITDYGDAVEMHLAEGSSVPEYVMQGEDLRVNFWYDFNGRTSRIATDTYYRLDGTGSWIKATEGGIRIPNLYETVIPAYELFDHDYIEFYVINSNTLRNTIRGIYKVEIRKLNEVDGIRTNISEGEEIGGTVSITANDGGSNSATKIYIDGTQYTTTPMLEDGAYFSYVTNDIGGSAMNQLTTTSNETIAHIGNFMFVVPVNQLVHIDNSYFSYKSSKYTVTLRFWAGTDGIASEDYLFPSGGRDDYSVTELQLKLPNGNTYLPSSIGPSSYNGVDTSAKTNLSTALSAVHYIGDSSKTCPYMDVTFSVPASEVNAVGFSLDTTKLSDGKHTLKVTNGSYTKTVTFIVDNTAPMLDLGIADGASLTKDISISPTITEANGMRELVVLLDGQQIDTPYTTTAYALGEGSHTLQATVVDIAGNSTTKKISFTVDDISMTLSDAGAKDITGTAAKLYLTAQSDSATNVTFYKAERIEAAQILTETVSGLVPYLSYTIDVGNATDGDDIVVNWNGAASNADDTHACNMFVRNTTNGRWEPIATADDNGSITNASFPVANHVENGKALVIVQCTAGSSLPDTDTVNDGKTGTNTSWDGNSAPDGYDFAFAWLSDTQAYVQRNNYHQLYLEMNQWIVDNRDSWKISYVMHTGDLIDDPDAIYMWENADEAMKIFDEAGMPYGVLAGNHDVYAMMDIRDEYYAYFGEDRVKDQPTFGGSYENNYGHYDLVSQNGQDFIIVYMSYNVYEDEINWINEVLAKYSDRKAILCFHAYTHVYESVDGYLSYYGVLLRDQVVAKNPNVFAVLSGHYSGSSYQTVRFDDNGDGKLDRTVYQICTDYQSVSKGGLEYIKFLYFDLDNDKVFVNSYSPYMDDFNYYDTTAPDDLYTLAKASSSGVCNKGDIDAVVMSVDFDITTQTIQGNSFSAAIYTDEVLGTAAMNSTTGFAQTQATGLDPETNYSWYAILDNENTGYLRTGLYDLTTGHNYVAVVTKPTCTTGGYTTHTCTACGDSYTDSVVAATGHSWTSATCTAAKTCTVCGVTEGNASGHSYDSGTVTTPPGCTTTGIKTYTCSACGGSYTETISASGHSWQEATCTAAKTCGVCGTTEGSKLDHSYERVVTAPTCTKDGYTTYTCSVCGHSYTGDVVIATGHSYDTGTVSKVPTCTTAGIVTYTCTECGDTYNEVVLADGHTYESVVTAPTCVKDGYTTYTCSVCGDSYTGNTVAATGVHTYVDGVCTGCGAVEVVPTISMSSASLALKDEVQFIGYFKIENIDASTATMGLITYKTQPTEISVETAEEVIPGAVYDSANDRYIGYSQGVPAKEMGDTYYIAAYAQLADGSYVYSGIKEISVKKYAYTMLPLTSDENLQKLLIAMLNYGAEAQLYFGYKTDELVNADLTDAQKNSLNSYSADLMDPIVKADSAKTGNFVYTEAAFSKRSVTVTAGGALALNCRFNPAYTMDGDMTLYYWDAATYDSVDALTLENATGSAKMTVIDEAYQASVTGIAAKDIDKTIYVVGVYESDGVTYTTGVISYNLNTYFDALRTALPACQTLCEAAVVYCDYAKLYFLGE